MSNEDHLRHTYDLIQVELRRNHLSDSDSSRNEPLESNITIDDFLYITMSIQQTGTLHGKLLENDDVIANTIELPASSFDKTLDPVVHNTRKEEASYKGSRYEFRSDSKGSISLNRPKVRERSPLFEHHSSGSNYSRTVSQVEIPVSSEKISSRYSKGSPIHSSERSSPRRSERSPPRNSGRSVYKSSHSSSSDRRRHDHEDYRRTRKHLESPESRRKSSPPPLVHNESYGSQSVALLPEIVRYQHLTNQQGFYSTPASTPTVHREPPIANNPNGRMVLKTYNTRSIPKYN